MCACVCMGLMILCVGPVAPCGNEIETRTEKVLLKRISPTQSHRTKKII